MNYSQISLTLSYFQPVKLLPYLLLPLSFLYGLGIYLRNLAYNNRWKKGKKLPVPIISVGNITVGGTGKTPMAEFLLEHLLSMGQRPAYLSRGYGRSTRGYLRVSAAAADGMRFGDEAFQVAHKFPKIPVVVCEDRVAGVKRLLSESEVDVVVLDDAFQHRRIHRDLDIVMVDGSRLPAKDWLLPAGNLRESRRGLHRADFVAVAKRPPGQSAAALPALVEAERYGFKTTVFDLKPVGVYHFFSEKVISIAELQGQSAHLFAGLGNNRFFFQQTAKLLQEKRSETAFADHYLYQKNDLEKILANLGPPNKNKPKFDGAIILTTEKDYFRLKSLPWIGDFSEFPFYYLKVKIVPVAGWKCMDNRIMQIIRTYGRHQ